MKSKALINKDNLISLAVLLLYCRYIRKISGLVFVHWLDKGFFSLYPVPSYAVKFVISYTALMLISGIVSLRIMDRIIPFLAKKNALKNNCPSMKHMLFYTQLISMALILIIPGYALRDSSSGCLLYLMEGGIPILAGLFLFAYLCSKTEKRWIPLLWVLLAAIYLCMFWHLMGHFRLALLMTVITMMTLPVYSYIAEHMEVILKKLIEKIVYLSFCFDDEDEDEEELPFE